MRKLILEEWLSLDGYAVDKNGSLNFFPSAEKNQFSDADQLKFLDTIDTIVLGRITYQLFVDFWPTASVTTEIIADKLNSIPKIICSNTLSKAPWGKWPEAELLKGDAVAGIKKLKAKEGKNIVLWGSLTLAQSLMKENMIDEYHIQVCPTLVGGGRRLFSESDRYTNMKLVSTRQYNTGVIYLHYEP